MTTTSNKCTGRPTKVFGRASVLVIAAICSLHAAGASAATISLGSQIVLAPDMFVVPVTITDATGVTGWTFDLRYDPLDVQVNLACDPFSGDVYCSLLTGPVTEGEFFASGTPFNVLNPGFVEVDPTTLTQTGLLFAVNGLFGGSPLGVSGDGVLAYVEFLKVGRGTSDVTLENPTATEVPVPEPGTLALLAIGCLLSRLRWHRRTTSHERTR
ncbi:MAG TPA: cohesin domain-containing protein [Vicinamibacterales bacterium]|nr:cohesin domain-containing protein [Vicinamibacterales bacterium]